MCQNRTKIGANSQSIGWHSVSICVIKALCTSDKAMPQAQFDVPGEAGRSMAIDDKIFIKIDWKPPTHNI